MFYRHVKGIQEAAGLDPEKLVAPKEFWFDSKQLEFWFDSRRELSGMREIKGEGE